MAVLGGSGGGGEQSLDNKCVLFSWHGDSIVHMGSRQRRNDPFLKEKANKLLSLDE